MGVKKLNLKVRRGNIPPLNFLEWVSILQISLTGAEEEKILIEKNNLARLQKKLAMKRTSDVAKKNSKKGRTQGKEGGGFIMRGTEEVTALDGRRHAVRKSEHA